MQLMPGEKNVSWSRLDNAAKIFPSTVEKSDTRVFRFSCELSEDIEREILQKAAADAASSYPNFNVVMKKGIFWYYLERCDDKIIVTEENLPVCAAIYEEDSPGLLYRVSYLGKRINLELFHVLSDGTGALEMLKTIVYRYLIYRYPEKFANDPPFMETAPLGLKTDDSFSKYYDSSVKGSRKKRVRAFRLSGERLDNNGLSVIEGFASVKSVIEAAHSHNATLTVFLTAVYIKALGEEIPLRSRKRPVVIKIPVNLRTYFPSETAKNFFGMISVDYDFSKESGEIADIAAKVKASFMEQLTKENLAVRMNSYTGLEHNPFARIAPLPLKNIAMKSARHISLTGETSVISNVGRIRMPEEFDEYISRFSVFVSTQNVQLNICSFNDSLQMGITSCFSDSNVQRNFFRTLTEQNIDVTIRSNGLT